ncbi:MAG: hypothetical protein AAF449_24105, partial [Myxococcota bacterium]
MGSEIAQVVGRTVALLVIGITATTSSCAFWPFNQFTDETEPAASGDTQPGVVARAEPSPPRFDPSDACFALPITEARIDRSLPRDFQQAKRAFDRGLRLQDDGRHTEALAEFQRALDADQTFGLAHLEAAVSHMYTDTSYGNAGVLAACSIAPGTAPGLIRKAPGMLRNPEFPLFLRWGYLPKLLP